ncbi:MAG: (d)CMP kinase [Christensenellales bacterium]|jgi:cytidylate kinase
MIRPISVAVDGPGGAGKSSVCRAVAEKLGILYLDTGAMYRATALYMTRRGISVADAEKVVPAMEEMALCVRYTEKGQRLFLADEDVTEALHTPEMDGASSAVSRIAEVRAKLVALQRQIAEGNSVIMDGRDIASVVLPNATLKIYLTADVKERAQRRKAQLLREKNRDVPLEEVLRDLVARDDADSTRAASPLEKAKDAVLFDTTGLSLEQVVEKVLAMIRERGAGL